MRLAGIEPAECSRQGAALRVTADHQAVRRRRKAPISPALVHPGERGRNQRCASFQSPETTRTPVLYGRRDEAVMADLGAFESRAERLRRCDGDTEPQKRAPPCVGGVRLKANLEDPEVLSFAKTLTIEHSWAPRGRILDMLRQAIKDGKSVVEIGQAG